MATINIQITIDTKNLVKNGIKGTVPKGHVIMSDDQFDDTYMDDDPGQLITRVRPGDVLIWTIKSSDGSAVYFTKFEVKKGTWFTEKGGLPVLDSSGRRYKGTIANVKPNEMTGYCFEFSKEPNKSLWKHDPFVEAREKI